MKIISTTTATASMLIIMALISSDLVSALNHSPNDNSPQTHKQNPHLRQQQVASHGQGDRKKKRRREQANNLLRQRHSPHDPKQAAKHHPLHHSPPQNGGEAEAKMIFFQLPMAESAAWKAGQQVEFNARHADEKGSNNENNNLQSFKLELIHADVAQLAEQQPPVSLKAEYHLSQWGDGLMIKVNLPSDLKSGQYKFQWTDSADSKASIISPKFWIHSVDGANSGASATLATTNTAVAAATIPSSTPRGGGGAGLRSKASSASEAKGLPADTNDGSSSALPGDSLMRSAGINPGDTADVETNPKLAELAKHVIHVGNDGGADEFDEGEAGGEAGEEAGEEAGREEELTPENGDGEDGGAVRSSRSSSSRKKYNGEGQPGEDEESNSFEEVGVREKVEEEEDEMAVDEGEEEPETADAIGDEDANGDKKANGDEDAKADKKSKADEEEKTASKTEAPATGEKNALEGVPEPIRPLLKRILSGLFAGK